MHEAMINLVKFRAYYTMILAAVLAVALGGTVFFWKVYPYEPLVINEFKVEEGLNDPGTELFYDSTYTKNTDKPEKVTVVYVCETSRTDSILKDQSTNLAQGKHTVKKVKLPVPNKVKPEQCRLEATVKYQMNPLEEVTVVKLSDPFYIGTPSATVTQ